MTFARLAKILAVLLVAFALWRARSPEAPVHIVILALPGASSDLFTGGAQATTLAKGPIAVPPATTGTAFWRRLFAATDDPGRDPGELEPVWAPGRASIRVLSVPSSLIDEDKASSGDVAFAGSSAGAVVESEDITSGRLPSPYDRAADAVAAAAAALGRDQWSDWITVEPLPAASPKAPDGSGSSAAQPVRPPAAQFQFARFGDSAYYFSPAYVFGTSPIARRPFLRGKEREMRPLVAAHAIAVTRRRLDPSRELFVNRSDARPVIVFDTVSEDTTAVFSPDSTPAGVLEQVRDAIAGEVALLRQADGPGEIVVAIGGPTTTRPAETAAWYHIVRFSGGANADDLSAVPLDFEAARATLRYALGFALDERTRNTVPVALVRSAAIRAGAPRTAPPESSHHQLSSWSAETLESVPGAFGSGH